MSFPEILLQLSTKASQELKNLLEQRHLYQKVDIDPASIVERRLQQLHHDVNGERLASWAKKDLPKERFTLAPQQISVALSSAPSVQVPRLTLIVLHVSLFCRECQRREAFAPLWYTDAMEPMRKVGHPAQKNQNAIPEDLQIFYLAYQCQRCLGKPECFIVRREAWRLELHGRSPIEHIEAPKYVPKAEAWLYRDAVIAFNSGKTLAALFYLRTFIEQFARRVTGLTGRATGDEIMDAYYKSLPSPNKDQMPSLRDWYDKLSECLHAARQDVALFETAKAQIEKHFDMRRVFEIPERLPEESKPAMAASKAPKSSPTN